jgi:hypothetical protein
MDATQMKYEFLITYESIASAAAPGYTNREISIFLTEAQEDIVKETIALGLDTNDLTRSIVRVLRKNRTISDTTLIPSPYRGYAYNFKWRRDDVFYPYSYTMISNILTPNSTVNIECKPMPEEAVIKNLKNPYKKPSNDKYWVVEGRNKIIIVPPKDVIFTEANDALAISYIRKPKPIIVADLPEAQAIDGFFKKTDCELDDIIVRDIIYKAAKKAFAATKDTAGYQIQNNEEKQ